LTRKSEVPFHSDASRRFVPLIVAAMVYLAALALTGAMAIGGTIERWSAGLQGTLTVQLPSATGDTAALETAARTETALAALLGTSGVATAVPLEAAELRALLEPWLGAGNIPGDLPVPVLIDVTIEPGAAVDLDALRQLLRNVVPGATLNDNGVWLEQLIRLARSVQWVAAIVVALVGTAAVAIVVFATRAGMSVHRDTIELLHVIGARDSYIARQFQFQAMKLGLTGGVIGLAFAGATLAALALAGSGVRAPLVPRVSLDALQSLALAALPLLAALIATATARTTVLRALRQTL
jgi:cell division transport system permease protein